ncbi:hypothetical protein HPP92_018787 [Vanilla planifolia]|uniref:Uncharacterized protein n=1 Tax=Vanilla planifolia TaxID=51239 RepID=A0A835QDJ9_VANPL|nr:hypothetical protein HPP92_018787 [Vanilla planifolia]
MGSRVVSVGCGCTHRTTATLPPPGRLKQPFRRIGNPNRRAALLLLSSPGFIALLSTASRASAFSVAISGPKEWLREQKKKAARFVLAPIEASRQSLRNAYLLLTSESPVEDAGELRTLLNSAARDCVPRERNSFVTLQAITGVEVCTFKLIVKNAASLLSNGDPIKLDAETRLDYLIRSLSLLGSTIDNSDLRMTSDREKVKNGLMNSISALDEFEQASVTQAGLPHTVSSGGQESSKKP